jgi:hypothetical protein
LTGTTEEAIQGAEKKSEVFRAELSPQIGEVYGLNGLRSQRLRCRRTHKASDQNDPRAEIKHFWYRLTTWGKSILSLELLYDVTRNKAS